MKEEFKNYTIIIPTLNEEKNIKILLEFLIENYQDSNIIIVDDNSKDNTIPIIQNFSSKNNNIKLIIRDKNEKKGLTASILDGIKNVKTKYFLVIDGDMQHPPGLILEMISLMHSQMPNLIVGYKESVPKQTLLYRKFITWFGNILGKFRLYIKGKPCKDILSGFFCCETDFFFKFADFNKFEPEGYKILFDFLKQIPKSTKLMNIPFSFAARLTGNSKLNKNQMKIYLKSIFK